MAAQGAAALGLPRAWAASGGAADSHPTTHASHSFHRAATVDVGTRPGKKKPTTKKQTNQCRGMAGTKGQVTASQDLSSGGKRKIVSYREEAAQTREKKREREGEEQKQATERKTEGERDGEKEKRQEKAEEECMSESQREQEGQGRLVARPFMARTRRGRQGVSPGT